MYIHHTAPFNLLTIKKHVPTHYFRLIHYRVLMYYYTSSRYHVHNCIGISIVINVLIEHFNGLSEGEGGMSPLYYFSATRIRFGKIHTLHYYILFYLLYNFIKRSYNIILLYYGHRDVLKHTFYR